jgi:hypothetical protein
MLRCKGGDLEGMLDDKKILVIEMLVDGELPKTQIATRIGCSSQALYQWSDNDEFKADLDKRFTIIRTDAFLY